MEELHMGYVFTFLALSVIATFIMAIPSGPQCIKCSGYFTEQVYESGTKKVNQEKVLVYYVACHRCRNKFNIKINGVDRSNFNDVELNK